MSGFEVDPVALFCNMQCLLPVSAGLQMVPNVHPHDLMCLVRVISIRAKQPFHWMKGSAAKVDCPACVCFHRLTMVMVCNLTEAGGIKW